MNSWLQVVLGAAISWPLCLSAADCNTPRAPESIPDGNTASKADMISAMAAFNQYKTEVTAYLNCLETEKTAQLRDAGDDVAATLKIRSIHTKMHHAAVDELETVADKFGAQARKFRRRK